MRVYKALTPLQALSFDLDDTLYPNQPIILAAELAMQRQLQQQIGLAEFNTPEYWALQRRELAIERPDIKHDVSRWRLLAVERGLQAQGWTACAAAEMAEVALMAFLAVRTRIVLPVGVRPLLAQLAARWPLIAITNGNADLSQMGIADLFQFSLRAGPDGRMKPNPDLFVNAAHRLQIPTSSILHIGDHVDSDVKGALNAGCQACWLNLAPQQPSRLKVLPHLEISQLESLKNLLKLHG